MLQTQEIQETYSPALPTGYALHEYTIEKVLGIGGFGITYLAHDNHLHHKVAIKEFFPANLAARNPATGTVGIKSPDCQTEFTWGKTRYTQEAQTLARFNHPNIVRVSRYFEANSTSYLVMDFEEGKSLEAILNEGQEWTESRLLGVLLPLLSGLAEIHKVDYLHRDIKPDNIILRSKDNSPVLLDFGAARSTTSNMTAMVSPGYGPAEQYSTDHADQGPWTDIYALAAVAYRIISGRIPVPAPHRIKKDTLIPAVFMGQDRYTKPFLTAIDLALSIDEKKRPQTVTTWAETLTPPQPVETAPEPQQQQPEPEPTHDQPPIRIPDPIRPPAPPHNQTTSQAPTTPKPMPPREPPRETFLQKHDISSQQLWISGIGIFLAIAAIAIGLLFTDKGYLRTAHFLYTTALKANNPEFTYTFICPSYFQSEMTRKNLDSDMNATQWVSDIAIDTPEKATITTSLPDHTHKQTWSKPTASSLWCRDVLADYKNNKSQPQKEQTKTPKPTTAKNKK